MRASYRTSDTSAVVAVTVDCDGLFVKLEFLIKALTTTGKPVSYDSPYCKVLTVTLPLGRSEPFCR